MPRGRRPHLKKRKDGRYCKVYKGQQIMGWSEDEVYDKYDAIVALEEQGVGRIKTVGEYAQEWLPIAYPAVADSTYHGLAIHLEKMVDVIGNLTLDKVTPFDVKKIYSTKYLNMSNSYIKAARQLYCLFFDAAIANGMCRTNPARDKSAKPHKGNKPKERFLTDQERQWITTLCTDHRTYPAVMTMLYAGVRPQEVKAINIDRDVDFDREIITVQETVHVDGQKYDFTEEMKTDWSKRQIPLFPPLKQALKGKHGYLITSAHGERVTIQTWKTAWESYINSMETAINGVQKRWYGKTKEQKKMAEDGTLQPWVDFNVVPYTLRHAFCRMCRDNGVEINTCRKWMGHADTAMIMKVYDAVSDDRSESEAEKLKKLFDHMQNDMQDENVSRETG